MEQSGTIFRAWLPQDFSSFAEEFMITILVLLFLF